jgi:hypothetical protein
MGYTEAAHTPHLVDISRRPVADYSMIKTLFMYYTVYIKCVFVKKEKRLSCVESCCCVCHRERNVLISLFTHLRCEDVAKVFIEFVNIYVSLLLSLFFSSTVIIINGNMWICQLRAGSHFTR